MGEQTLIGKISVAKVFGKLDRKDLPKGTIMRVVGIANGVRTGTSNFGAWEAVRGDFYAVNLLTGEEFRSGQCFMPNTAISLVTGALAGSPDGVEFAFDFGVKANDSTVGYEYTVKPVVKAKESEAMTSLLERANAAAPLALGNSKKK